MADGPQIDIGAQNFARGIGASTGKTKTDDYVNAENAAGEHVKASLDKAGEALGLTVPVAGKAISLIFSGNSAASGLESEGIAGKMIMPSFMPDAQGGFLARLLHSVFIKNREVTDHTAGVGGSGDYTGGSSGGGDYTGGDAFAGGSFSDSRAPDFSQFASRSESFDWSPVSLASLGALPRPAVPDMGPASGAAIEV